MEDYPNITTEQRAEIDAIFSNEELLRCMECRLSPPVCEEPETPHEVKMQRMKNALDAFSKNPIEWWDF